MARPIGDFEMTQLSKRARAAVYAVMTWAAAAPAVAQEAMPPVPEPASQPKTEFSTPESAIGMVRLALAKSDAAAFKECFYNGDTFSASFMDAFGEFTIATSSLAVLAREKFKDDPEAAKFTNAGAALVGSLECSTIEVEGDTAKGVSEKDPGKLVHFKKVEGKWKIDSIQTMRMREKGMERTLRAAMDAMPAKTKSFNQVKAEMRAGKIGSLPAMRARLAELMADKGGK
jgi:hypothetical protein